VKVTFRYRIYPTKKQEILLAKHFLNQRKEAYNCDQVLDRDINAAKNILREGLKTKNVRRRP